MASLAASHALSGRASRSETKTRRPPLALFQAMTGTAPMSGGPSALLQLGFEDFQSTKLADGTDICTQRGEFVKTRMEEVAELGWDVCDIRWHTWRDFDNFNTLWPLMDPLNDLHGLQDMLASLGLDSADQRRLFKQHPDIASLSPGRIGTRFLELRAMGLSNDVILTALLAAPVLFSWDTISSLQSIVPQETFERLCGAFRNLPGRSQCQDFRPHVYRSQYIVPAVVTACQELGIENLYLTRTQLLTTALDLASGENPFSPVKYGSYTPLLRIPQGLQNAADVDRWESVLRSNMRYADRLWEDGAHDILLTYGSFGLMLYKPGDIETIWRAHALDDNSDCWD